MVECEVNQTKVVEDLPLKGSEVCGPLQTTDGLWRTPAETICDTAQHTIDLKKVPRTCEKRYSKL